MLQAFTLVVLTTSQQALPEMKWWWHDQQAPLLFGYTGQYFNPNRRLQGPIVMKAELLGFYPIQEPCGTEFVCNVAREQISLVMVVPLLPGEAYKLFQQEGLGNLKNLATETYYPNQHSLVVLRAQIAA